MTLEVVWAQYRIDDIQNLDRELYFYKKIDHIHTNPYLMFQYPNIPPKVF